MNYIPLNIKTHYELLSSLINIDDLILYAKSNNIDSLGVTDSNMFGCIEFYNKCIENNIKPIIGISINVDDIDMILYARNYEGYINLCNIVSTKNISSVSLEYIKSRSDNLICVLLSYDKYEIVKSIFSMVYLGYTSVKEKNECLSISKNIVYVNECLCISESDNKYINYVHMIKNGKTISDGLEVFDNHIDREISKMDSDTTISFSNLIDFKFPKFSYKLPEYSTNSLELLKSLCRKGLEKRLNNVVSKVYVDRLKEEIDVISNMGYIDYFLIVYDFVLFAKKNGIVVGPGRGSAAGSLVSYTLGITNIDPIKYNLIFERFLNKDRITLPDIDIDFDCLRRDEVVSYVKSKYGIDKVANIITFGTLLPKQALRDVGRVLNIELSTIDKLCKKITGNETFQELEKNALFKEFVRDNELEELINISKKLEGLKRHTSIHAAGVVINSETLMNRIPLYISDKNLLTGYSMEYLEQMGLIKMDFLAIKNLTIIDNIIKLIHKNEGKLINVNDIDLNDKKTLELFNKVDTTGIFQFESSGMKGFLKKLKIKSFDDVVSGIALYRPGPRDNIDLFIRNRENPSRIKYLLPELEPILKSTYGVIIYQEQILEILKSVVGYTYSEADNIRRAMSKKKEDVILKEKEVFLSKLKNKNVSENLGRELFDLILKFANYGFNKSHSVAYSMVAFYMAYLKANYREYFICYLLNNVIGSEVKTKEYLDEGRVSNIEFVYPNINESIGEYFIKDNKIIMPLSIIKNVGSVVMDTILEERNKGVFTSYFEFIRRVYSSKVNNKHIESLIDAGALDVFGLTKREMHINLTNAINYANLCKDIDESLVSTPEIIKESEYTEDILMKKEFETYGFYIKNHPVTKYKRNNLCTLSNIKNYFDKVVKVIVLIEEKKEIKTKNKEVMCFVKVSDEYDKIEVIMFPKTYELYRDIKVGDVVLITGKVQKRMNDYQIVPNKIEKMK